MTPLLLCFILASTSTRRRAPATSTPSPRCSRGADVNEYDSLGGTPLLDAA